MRVGEKKFALIRAIPRTGSTHQIRVHLSSLGHPIVGDKIYGPNEQLYLRFIETGWTPELQKQLLLPRHALHSAKLAIEGEREWTSAFASDLAEFCSGGLVTADAYCDCRHFKFGAHGAPLQARVATNCNRSTLLS